MVLQREPVEFRGAVDDPFQRRSGEFVYRQPRGRWEVLLGPFAGSGTTLAVATGHGRDAIGIDLDSRNAELCAERVGMFLEIDEPETAA